MMQHPRRQLGKRNVQNPIRHRPRRIHVPHVQHAQAGHLPDEAVDGDGVRVMLNDAVLDGGGGFKEQAGDAVAFVGKSVEGSNGNESAEAGEHAYER